MKIQTLPLSQWPEEEVFCFVPPISTSLATLVHQSHVSLHILVKWLVLLLGKQQRIEQITQWCLREEALAPLYRATPHLTPPCLSQEDLKHVLKLSVNVINPWNLTNISILSSTTRKICHWWVSLVKRIVLNSYSLVGVASSSHSETEKLAWWWCQYSMT